MVEYNTIIIGAGISGISCAIYLKRAGIKVLLLENSMPGGQLNKASVIENYPGYESIAGSELANNMFMQLEKLGVDLEKMKANIGRLVVQIVEESKNLHAIVDHVEKNISDLGGDIDTVSSTTQELAASMEETSSVAATVANMSQEIEDAAKNVANRSQDGAKQASDIHTRASEAKETAIEQRNKMNRVHKEMSASLTKALEEA